MVERVNPLLPISQQCRLLAVSRSSLFERRRDLFSDLSLVFMDTTSLSFCGAGGDSLGAPGSLARAFKRPYLSKKNS